MGLKRRNFVYVSDRGDEYEIEEMQSSHLINAINHHQKQYQVVHNILQGGNFGSDAQMANLEERRDALGETIITLEQELASRSLEDDAKREEGRNTYHRY